MRKQRPGTFTKGHEKLGGRKRGTPNRFNKDLIEAIVQAAEQVGSDGKGKNGVDGNLARLAGKKEGYFVSLLRQAVQKQVPTAEPENEIVYATDQDFRQALLDSGVHPTLLPPPPRDFNERPPFIDKLVLPKAPPGWKFVLIRTVESAEIEQTDSAVEENLTTDRGDEPTPLRQEEIPPARAFESYERAFERFFGLARIPGWRWYYNPCTNKFFARPAGEPPPELS